MIIFAPLVFFVLIRSENVEVNLSKLHQPLALIFAVIILSGGVITPFSIGDSYWSMAYADDSSFDTHTTSSEDSASSSSTPAEDTESTGDSSSTQELVVDGTIDSLGTNATTTEVIPGTNSTVIPGTNSTELPVVLPNATESWQFDNQVNGSRFIGDVYIQSSNSSLILGGDGYVVNDGILQAIYPISQLQHGFIQTMMADLLNSP